MTPEDQSLTDTFDTDTASDTILEDVTVPSGELWYVEELHVDVDGTGDAGSMGVSVAVSGSDIFTEVTPSDYELLSRGNDTGLMETDAIDSGSATVDAYASEGEVVRVGVDQAGGANGTAYYSLAIRRVL